MPFFFFLFFFLYFLLLLSLCLSVFLSPSLVLCHLSLSHPLSLFIAPSLYFSLPPACLLLPFAPNYLFRNSHRQACILRWTGIVYSLPNDIISLYRLPFPPPLQRLCNDILWTLALPPSHAFIYFRFFPHPALFQVYIVGFVYYETFPDGLLNGPPSTTLSPARLGVYFFCIALLPLPVATESLACHLRARSEHRLIMPFWTEMFGNTTKSVWSPYSCLSDPYVTVQGGNHQRRASILEFLSMLAS